MTNATIRIPEPEPTGPIKDQMYRYRGEAVSIGGAMDWIIWHLATRFAGSKQPTTSRRWNELKADLKVRNLTNKLQQELSAVATAFDARVKATHAITLPVQIGESTQILRLYFDRDTPQGDQVTIEDFRQEATDARKGYQAVQAVARALDQDQPSILAGASGLARAMLIGTTI
jgi:hypothetical protein